MTKPKKIVDLSQKRPSIAKKIMKRILFRKDPTTGKIAKRELEYNIQFLLPSSNKPKHRNYQRRNEDSKCPYCASRLVSTENGVVCTGETLRSIVYNIENMIKQHGEKAELFMSNKCLRFLDYYKAEGALMTCTYVLGDEEQKYRINNRIMTPGIDRKKIFKTK